MCSKVCMKECCEACDGHSKKNGETCKYCKGVGWFEDDDYKAENDPYLMADEFLGSDQHE